VQQGSGDQLSGSESGFGERHRNIDTTDL
jgi:hypothetical protein